MNLIACHPLSMHSFILDEALYAPSAVLVGAL